MRAQLIISEALGNDRYWSPTLEDMKLRGCWGFHELFSNLERENNL